MRSYLQPSECFYWSQYATHHTMTYFKETSPDWHVPPGAQVTLHSPMAFHLSPQSFPSPGLELLSLYFLLLCIISSFPNPHSNFSFPPRLYYSLPAVFVTPSTASNISTTMRILKGFPLLTFMTVVGPEYLWNKPFLQPKYPIGLKIQKTDSIIAKPYFFRLKSIPQPKTLMKNTSDQKSSNLYL